MRNKTKEGNFINTPMRKLIKKLPGQCSNVAAFMILFSFSSQNIVICIVVPFPSDLSNGFEASFSSFRFSRNS